QNGGGCDGEAQPVPFDDGPLRERNTRKSDGINEQKIRRRNNRLDRPIHGEASRFQNIHGIDFLLARAPDPKPDGPLRDLLIEPFPLGFTHLLGVIQSGQPKPAWQDHSSRNHRACERPTTGLVEARHETVATLLRFFVKVVGGVHSHLLKRSANSLQQAALSDSRTAIAIRSLRPCPPEQPPQLRRPFQPGRVLGDSWSRPDPSIPGKTRAPRPSPFFPSSPADSRA